jgi:polyisoprenoid-binding protein YceI
MPLMIATTRNPTQSTTRARLACSRRSFAARCSGRSLAARAIPLVALLTLALGAPRAARGQSQSYTLQAKRSSFVAHLLKAGLAKGFAHDHVIKATKLSGTISVDPAKLETIKLDLRVDTRSFDVDPPALRRAYGMKSMLDADDRKKVKRNLEAKDQLWVTKYPEIRFVSTSAKALGGKRYVVFGKLTIRGVTRAVRIKVSAWLKDGGKRLEGKGQLRFKQSNFGYKPYSAGLGLVKNRDPVTLNLYLVATR